MYSRGLDQKLLKNLWGYIVYESMYVRYGNMKRDFHTLRKGEICSLISIAVCVYLCVGFNVFYIKHLAYLIVLWLSNMLTK